MDKVIQVNADLEIMIIDIFEKMHVTNTPFKRSNFIMVDDTISEEFKINLKKIIDCHIRTTVDERACYQLSVFPNSSKSLLVSHPKKATQLKDDFGDLSNLKDVDVLRIILATGFGDVKIDDLLRQLKERRGDMLKHARGIQKKTSKQLTRALRQYRNDGELEKIPETTLNHLKECILQFINGYYVQQFIMIIYSAGFKKASVIKSQRILKMAYILYLELKSKKMAKVLDLMRN